MRLTAKVKLLTTPEQFEGLKDTLKTANAACNHLSQLAWDNQTFKQFNLHRLGYHDTRERFKLSAQVVVRCISKVTDAYKLDKKTRRTFKPLGSIAFDARILTWKLDRHEVSIWTTAGRQTILFSSGERQRELLKTQQGESDLVLINGEFYLFAACNIPEPTPEDVEGYLGVDMGVVELATDSLGKFYSGASVKRARRKHRRLRKSLQKCGSRSAKRKLKKLSGREACFAKDTNHVVSKAIVATAKHNRLGIAVENLTGVTKRVRVKKAARESALQRGYDLTSWAFFELKSFLEYKSRLAGIPLIEVDPRNTSRTCSVCGHCDKANRKTQAEFACKACGYCANADFNAAVNIAAKADIKRPTVARVVSKSVHATSQLQAPSL